MGAGTRFLALPMMSAGVYLYKVKFGGSEFMIKSPLIDGISHGTATSVQGSSSNALAKQAKRAAAFNDAILATKDGYLNYRMGITNSDTSGIQIKMIVCAGTVTDADGNVYQTVRIGTQVWMVENLKTTRYNNGMAIPLVTDDAAWAALTTPGYCWYKNDSASYKNPYGALYNGYVVNTDKLAPTGWHVAMDADWATLTAYLGGDSVAGGKLKEAGLAHWASPNTGATNETGFSALPGGYCDDGGTFNFIGNLGYWWSSTALDATYSWYRDVYYGNEFVYRYANCFSTYGFSVRCLRD
jgi:uncharacterized protein (TIGR02145 family)